MKSKLSALVLVVVLAALAATPIAASPLHAAVLRDLVAGPCTPGGTYDSACDVDHDGDVDIFDVQKTAGHWNQSGTFTSDNNHNHLGQTWTGSNNPLTIDGSFTLPLATAALVLSNAAWGDGLRVSSAGKVGVNVVSAGGDGLRVTMAGSASSAQLNTSNDGFEVAGAEGNGLYVGRADAAGVSISSAGGDGLRVGQASDNGIKVDSASHNGVSIHQAGQPSAFFYSNNNNNGLEVEGAAGNGLYIGRADFNGLYVDSVGNNGLLVNSANTGLYVTSAGGYGVYVGSAGINGVQVGSAGFIGVAADTTAANHEWGLFTNDKIYAGAALASNGPLMLVAQSGDGGNLETGDMVVVSGVGAVFGESQSPTPLVRRAAAGDHAVMGVVYRRLVAEETVEEIDRDGQMERQTRLDTRSTEGLISPGDTLLVVVLGPAQVKVDSAMAIEAGQRLTIATDGGARPLGTIKVQLAGNAGTADLPESAPLLGVAMEPAKDGLVWVLVNPR